MHHPAFQRCIVSGSSFPEIQQNSFPVSPFNVRCNVSANPGCDWCCHCSVYSSLALSASVIPPDNTSGNVLCVYCTEDIKRSLVDGSEDGIWGFPAVLTVMFPFCSLSLTSTSAKGLWLVKVVTSLPTFMINKWLDDWIGNVGKYAGRGNISPWGRLKSF